MQQIIFDYINTDYAYGKYGEFTVIMMTSNRYINATKLCKQYGKEFKHWKENIGNKQLIEEVEKEISSVGYPSDELTNKSFIIKTGGRNELLRGTYVHELLIPHIASWISPQFGIKVSKIVNSYIINEYITELKQKDNIIKDKDNIITEKNTNIEKLGADIKELLKNQDIILSDNKNMKSMLEKNQLKLDKTFDKLVGMNEKLEEANDKIDETYEELEVIKDKLDIATDDRVVKTKSKTTLEYLIILKTDDENEDYKYYIIRCQKRSIKQRLENNLSYREIKRIEYVPNSINLFNRIKEKLKNNLDIKSSKINLININEIEFLNKIDLINKEKKII
jgi:hypothetical protein